MSSESFLALSSSTSSTSSSSTGRTSTEVVLAGLGRTRTPAITLVVLVVLVILVILVVPVGLEDRRKYSFSTCRPQKLRIPSSAKAPSDHCSPLTSAMKKRRKNLAKYLHESPGTEAKARNPQSSPSVADNCADMRRTETSYYAESKACT